MIKSKKVLVIIPVLLFFIFFFAYYKLHFSHKEDISNRSYYQPTICSDGRRVECMYKFCKSGFSTETLAMIENDKINFVLPDLEKWICLDGSHPVNYKD